MNTITVVLSGISIITTLTIVVLGSLLSKCRTNSSHDTIMGGKTEVEKDEYGLLIMDGGECSCTTGFMAMSWTILEDVVTGVLTVKAVMMTIGIVKEKKQRRLIEKQKQEEERREQICLEERNRIEAIETT